MTSPGSAAECFLRRGVFGVVIDDDLALIDLDADDYLCFPGGAVSVERQQADNLVLGGPGTSQMIDAGLTADTRPPGMTLPTLPTRSVIHESPPPLTWRHILSALGAVRAVRRALRSPGLHPVLAVSPRPGLATDPVRVIAAAKAFWRIAPWLTIEGECLVRSALLMNFLGRMGLSADWVFGVRLWPFSAHCWVQSGDVCLNDDVERLVAYTPIYRR